MKKNHSIWSAYRITWLLYIGILLTPAALYFLYHQINSVGEGEAVVRKTSENGAMMLALTLTQEASQRKRLRSAIEKNFRTIEPWYRKQEKLKLYVGPSTPWKDFQNLLSCWHELSSKPESSKALECWSRAHELTFAIERTNTLTLDRIRNLFFVFIALSLGLFLLLVYFIRYYMHCQVCRYVIQSPREELQDREYCHQNFKHLCAQSERTGRPLSGMHINVKEKNRHNMEKLADAILEVETVLKEDTRLSDTVCRIADTEFMILMPNTAAEGAHRAKERMDSLLLKKLDDLTKDIELITEEKTKEDGEECESFWKRLTNKG